MKAKKAKIWTETIITIVIFAVVLIVFLFDRLPMGLVAFMVSLFLLHRLNFIQFSQKSH